MNTELVRIMKEGECRYLTASESDRIRDYAMNLGTRIDATRALEESESLVLRQTLERHFTEQGEAIPTGAERQRLNATLASALRWSALAHIQDDEALFRRGYAEWMSEMTRSVGQGGPLAAVVRSLMVSIAETLDPPDARAFNRYLEVLATELAS
jgi:hypothetical protein